MHTTTIAVHDNTPMPFGKFKNKAMVNVPAIYLLWLYDNGCTHAGVRQYIENNLDILKKEASRVRR